MFLTQWGSRFQRLQGLKVQCGTLRWYGSLPNTINQLLNSPPDIGSNITVCGHIKTIRKFKKIGFVDISDGSSYRSLPIVIKNIDQMLAANPLKVGQSIQVRGTIKQSKGQQDYELSYDASNSTNELTMIGDVEDTYPIQKKAMTLPYLRHHSSLRHRTSTLSSILRIRSFLETKFTEFFDKSDFIKVAPPMLTGSDCEGAGEQFQVDPINPKTTIIEGKPVKQDFFGKPVFLTVSTQLHLEVLSPSVNRVWTLAPCFRAEDSNTNRHLNEFWLLEAEISYINKVDQLTEFTETMIKHVTRALLNQQKDDVLGARYSKDEQELLQHRWNTILSTDKWPVITYDQAIELINNHPKTSSLEWGDSILTEHEKWLAGDYFKSPVFITDYPKQQKPFYMPNSEVYDESKPTVACFDLIFPYIGELVGGSIRQHNYDQLVEEMNYRGMNVQDMQWYLTIRQNGSVPHGGFGMGFERLILYLTGLENIKDIVAFPRSPDVCDG